jgi:hypothetical protein
MSLEKIHLRKLLQLIYATPAKRRGAVLSDIGSDARKLLSPDSSGGDFYGPFWADAKDYVAGKSDLREQTKGRIAANRSRQRLYPLLRDGFLQLWTEKVRWRNEEFEFLPTSVKAQLSIDELNATIKIENVVAVRIWDGTKRVVYPYFSEEPVLPNDGARLGFWALGEALPDFKSDDFRIIDVLRGSYFRPGDVPLRGNERETLVKKYGALLAEWNKLRDKR